MFRDHRQTVARAGKDRQQRGLRSESRFPIGSGRAPGLEPGTHGIEESALTRFSFSGHGSTYTCDTVTCDTVGRMSPGADGSFAVIGNECERI